MKKTFLLLITVIMAITATSCVEFSGKYRTALQQRDSLQTELTALSTEYENTIQTLNDIEKGFQEIRANEGRIMLDIGDAEGTSVATTKKRITAEMNSIKDILADNKAKISKLQSSLNKANKKNKSLMETIERYETEMNEKNALITSLQEELANKNMTIESLNNRLGKLSTYLTQVKETNEKQEQQISEQTAKINTVYYCIGTKKELAAASITSGESGAKSREIMQKDFDKSAFQEQDKTKFHKIIFEAKKYKILSNHPAGSYTVETDETGFTTINITDTEKFWSTTKYLVIQK